jgi:hypothetical protein
MARKTPSRLQKRREAEAAGATAKTKKAEGKKPAKKRVSRRKVKAPDRKRLFWGVFSGTLKEEARFNYDERKQAEEKLELLRSKSKKLYFIQPIKEVITAESGAARPEPEAKPARATKSAAPKDDDEEEEDEDEE